MVSWFALVQFEKPLENFKSRIWTVSLANPTPHKETGGPDPFRRVPRVVYITKATSEKHCCTVKCGKCRAIQRAQSQTTVGHTTDCRKPTEELLGNDMVFQHRLEQANKRGPRSWRLLTRSGS